MAVLTFKSLEITSRMNSRHVTKKTQMWISNSIGIPILFSECYSFSKISRYSIYFTATHNCSKVQRKIDWQCWALNGTLITVPLRRLKDHCNIGSKQTVRVCSVKWLYGNSVSRTQQDSWTQELIGARVAWTRPT